MWLCMVNRVFLKNSLQRNLMIKGKDIIKHNLEIPLIINQK